MSDNESPKHKSPEERMAQLNAIAEQAEKNQIKLALEQGMPINVDAVANEMNQEGELNDSTKAEEEAKAAEVARLAAEAASSVAKTKVKAKVDGVEEEVEIEYLTNQYQKFKHAEIQMQKAAEMRKDLELREREFEIHRKQALDFHDQKMKELEQGQKQSTSAPAATDSTVKDAMSTLLLGDEEKAAKSLEEAINAKVHAEIERRMQQHATTSRAEVEKIADEKLAQAQSKSRWDAVVVQAQTKNPEFFDDEVRSSVWEGEVRKAFQAGMTPEQAAQTASEKLSKAFSKPEQVEAKKAEGFKVSEAELRETDAKKAEAKRYQVDGKAVAVSAGKNQGDEREMTQSEIIAQMRDARMNPKQITRK